MTPETSQEAGEPAGAAQKGESRFLKYVGMPLVALMALLGMVSGLTIVFDQNLQQYLSKKIQLAVGRGQKDAERGAFLYMEHNLPRTAETVAEIFHMQHENAVVWIRRPIAFIDEFPPVEPVRARVHYAIAWVNENDELIVLKGIKDEIQNNPLAFEAPCVVDKSKLPRILMDDATWWAVAQSASIYGVMKIPLADIKKIWIEKNGDGEKTFYVKYGQQTIGLHFAPGFEEKAMKVYNLVQDNLLRITGLAKPAAQKDIRSDAWFGGRRGDGADVARMARLNQKGKPQREAPPNVKYVPQKTMRM